MYGELSQRRIVFCSKYVDKLSNVVAYNNARFQK